MIEKIPYGKSNFEQVKDGEYLFIDKTKYIEVLEQENSTYQFFIRPRRFGKSLFISMLENYYDINQKDKFDYLFGDLYIGKNPTKERNTYLVLKLSFASIVTDETKERLVESFDDCIRQKALSFLEEYEEILNIESNAVNFGKRGGEAIVRYLVEVAKKAGQKIMVLIDEYDNFANDIVGKGKDDPTSPPPNLGGGEVGVQSEGYVRVFYKALKDGTAECISRIFITGVSPIMLDDLTSGFNITENFSTAKFVNEMLGLTENEVREVIKRVEADKILSMEFLIMIMKRYFNGYLFNPDGENRVYNTDMVLYFLDLLTKEGKIPEQILDQNVKTDYKKLQQMAFSFKDEELLDKLIKESDRGKLEEVKKEGLEQLKKYVNEKVKGRIKVENLKKALVIVIGKNEAVILDVE